MTTAKHRNALMALDEDKVLRDLMSRVAAEKGDRFFEALVDGLAEAIGVHSAWITEYLPQQNMFRALAYRVGDKIDAGWEYDTVGTPCERVIEGASLVHHIDNVQEVYPNDSDLKDLNARSYLGVPLLDTDGSVLGHMAAIDTLAMPEHPTGLAIFQIFASRAAVELQRIRAERQVKEREEKLRLLVGGAMDAIIELDSELKITMINAAAETMFAATSDITGADFTDFLTPSSKTKLARLIEAVNEHDVGLRNLWIPQGLEAIRDDSVVFPAEATLSRFDVRDRCYYTLILRDVNDRLKADKQIQSLTIEAEYLREEIRAIHNSNEIVGDSESLRDVLADIEQVAPTEATVLVLGETGTGKELIARAVHTSSRRKDKPLIKVDCASLPESLIESELFGHEKGAFTGATKKRDGRFALADGGTIFLDEIGELSIDLQAKLLRVLQEGEFSPVGSSRTVSVDVRVIAATNRDLLEATRDGEFREDLYYRLAVFPLNIPPLRARREDIPRLAAEFIKRFAQRIGKDEVRMSDSDLQRLSAYEWPGNIRELQNVIERALITSQNGILNLDRALPESRVLQEDAGHYDEDGRIRTAEEMRELERRNIERALESTSWNVSGRNGAARLLGVNPSTLNSRIKALRIRRPN